ncbi:MAG: hypothetical protein EOM42_14960 [Negativicutes bacterium]|nr:hypothetical protein [Negativicutes bacterium]
MGIEQESLFKNARGDCRDTLAMTGKAVLRCGDGMAAAKLAFCHCEERSDEAISSVSYSLFFPLTFL